MSELQTIYLKYKSDFDARLDAFRTIWKDGTDEDIFAELCYCLCTAREKAKNAASAICALRESKKLLFGTEAQIDAILLASGIALHPQKAKRIIESRAVFYPNTKQRLNDVYLCLPDIREARKALVQAVNGFGYKEASHFLRNIGFGSTLAILDRHIAYQLVMLKVLSEMPKSWTPKKYCEAEAALLNFAAQEQIPPDALDMVLMYKENPEVLK
ncbi:putative N-glycosylase/DNA lyase [Spirochaetia bacterium]|nr:putative N-glycosylase/DNA lyase [Spirochaetia bacterium]